MRSKKREALENLKADKFDLEGGTCIQNGDFGVILPKP